ncbi:MAG: RnfABCDGE type electron transport complex subunit D [Bacteroidetes bacterium]|nr:RnfABCDGE type electron transport complex subunit D [Bacteroidota bacterium]
MQEITLPQTDARWYQIGFQSAFLLFGTLVLGWQQEWWRLVLIIATCLSVQVFFIWRGLQNLQSFRSALITALGLCLLLRTSEWWVLVLAGAVAISSKFFIKINGKHIFNPANIGIVAAIFFTGKAWISPGQWGSDTLYPISILIAGFIVCYKVKRAQTGFIFLGILFALEFAKRYLFLGWPMDLVLHRFSSGSLLVYALFMITDPMTTPNHKLARMVWATILALLTFILSARYQIYEAPVWALFLLSPFTPLFDKLFQANKFEWKQNTKVKLYETQK